jgi:hypothetical protein
LSIGGKFRTLTPIEAERLNGFPDNWTDTMPDRMRYFCLKHYPYKNISFYLALYLSNYQENHLAFQLRLELTSEASVNRSSHFLSIGGKFRTLTPIEAERLNGPIRVTSGTTKALPIQKYLILSGIVSVQLSGKPFTYNVNK